MSVAPNPGVLDITPYVAGRAEAPGAARVFKLSSNESPLGPSCLAVAAYDAARDGLSFYPEGSARPLREALGEFHRLDPERIVCGNGSEELLALLARLYVSPGDEVLFSEHGFLVYRIAALASSGVPIAVPEQGLRADVDAIAAAVTARTRIVYLANPNNPTGSCLSSAELRRLHAALPPQVLLVVDSAYAEYVRRDDYEAGAHLVSEFDNVVMTRTFSKIYGLAGLRVGWAYCPVQVADAIHRVRGAFNVSAPAQCAATAALRDRAHVSRCADHNATWKTWLTGKIRAAGLRVDDSEGNFVLIHFPAHPYDARSADAYLTARGFILRPVANYGLPHCLRLTIGSEEANEGVTAALAEFLQRSLS